MRRSPAQPSTVAAGHPSRPVTNPRGDRPPGPSRATATPGARRRFPVQPFDDPDGLLAAASWLVGHDGARLPADQATLARAFAAAGRVGWWWPHTRFVVVSGPPVELHIELVRSPDTGGLPSGGYRLHRDDGPAVRWADGYAVHYLHGTEVLAALVEGGDVAAIHRRPTVRSAAPRSSGSAGPPTSNGHAGGWSPARPTPATTRTGWSSTKTRAGG
ncbi:DUF6745 domain-containing protein [Phytohabitans aurantiacus]|uniref:DUF6745 domain-containing protein n=1 Tax=Phytohabitans aurantiacus TaxID=3016789 RepID=A0ABQ5RAC2_9ACTN|nr:hypothetical protein [Phytohabitans aurantiacus]GLI02930.1 hypothetical protein Pa4123_82080 [Phytohabitans aurantiacus]